MYPGEAHAERRSLTRQQCATFRARENLYGSQAAAQDAAGCPAWKWWDAYGRETPQLQDFARRVLSAVSSSSSCERVWSNYDLIHSARRNRLTPARAEKLVFCYANKRLHSRSSGEEAFEGWDEA